MTDDNLAWEIMRDHYRTLYLTSPGFRKTVNWKAMSYSEMLYGDYWWTIGHSKRYTLNREAFVRKQHEKGVKALETVLQSILRGNPALAAERRCAGAGVDLKQFSIEEQRMYRDIMWARYNAHRQIRTNWYRRNQERLEGSKT